MASDQWKQVRDLFVSTNIIDSTSPVNAKDATLLDFAVALKDGYAICALANKIEPQAVPAVNKNPQLQFLCFENITGFLKACVKKFNLKKEVLFTVEDLFHAANFVQVLNCIAALTRTKNAKTVGIQPIEDIRAVAASQQATDDDIYEHLPSLVENADPDAMFYSSHAAQSEVPSDKLDYDSVEDIYEALPDVKKQKQTLAMEPSMINVPEDAYIDKRQYILDELLDTERNYTRDLEVMVDIFYYPLIEQRKWPQSDIDIIFSNVVDLYKIHVHLLGKLQTAVVEEKGADIARVFFAATADLLQYANYCANIEDAEMKIKELTEKRPDFNDFCIKAKKESKQNFPLKDLIKTPMQRILRYPLFIEQLLKKTKEDHRDHDSLKTCLKSLKEVAVSINEAKRDKENMKNVMNLQSRLEGYTGPPLTEMGKLLKDGELDFKIGSEKKFKRRFLFLFDLGLIICQLKGNSYTFKQSVMLSAHTIEDVNVGAQQQPQHQWTLRNVKDDKESITFACKTIEIKARWLTAFTVAISNTPDSLVLMHRQKLMDSRGNKEQSRQHEFKMITYNKATFCAHCESLLWGISNQGFKCQGCGIDCHKRCISHIAPQCSGTTKGKNGAVLKSSGDRKSAPPRGAVEDKRKRKGSKEQMDMSWMSSQSEINDDSTETVVTVQARYDFVAKDGNELSFSAGDTIQLIDRSNPAWWKGIREGSIGYFPRSYVILNETGTPTEEIVLKTERSRQAHSNFLGTPSNNNDIEVDRDYDMVTDSWQSAEWFFGKLSGDKAKALLMNHEPGTFLVRESESRPGDYSMSLKNLKSVKHVRIIQKGNRYSLADTKYFNSIPEIVETYLLESLVKYFPDLPVSLTGWPPRE